MKTRKSYRLRSRRRTSRRKTSRRKTFRRVKNKNTRRFKGGSFFSDVNYLMQKASNLFSSNPNVPYGNVSTPVPPFSYFQNN
jgi:hypothetical protein